MTSSGVRASEDPCITAEVAFVVAWTETLDDYRNKRINSESCLQAALYARLVSQLPHKDGFRVFVESSIRVAGVERYFGDLVICKSNFVVAAIELKYKPKVDMAKIAVPADLKKLLVLRNYREKAKRVEIILRRFQGATKADVESFTFIPNRRLIFGVFCAYNVALADRKAFWKKFGPKADDDKKVRPFPPKLMICIGHTKAGYAVTPQVFGGKLVTSKIEYIDA